MDSREQFESRENQLIERLDEIAQEFNSVDFGLPWADAPLAAMQEAIKEYGQASRDAAIAECAEIAERCECGACECNCKNRDAILALKGKG